MYFLYYDEYEVNKNMSWNDMMNKKKKVVRHNNTHPPIFTHFLELKHNQKYISS